ncbi:ATP-dependent helicase [Paenibacillus sp. UMB4589-SE434]|uniref:ATP-dependent helicase n=1 Tax=Paenibacillus sp. UMB4589-SE434 TaxID=3046314 RepID=UPI00254C5365|nr:ATP-dependent helicase [Paenibacillus sp. UMB4589-SE434]MDK8182874.1 ATP-dependent helicase [Paenibacillus sp. UMB4589-SE434]
MKKEEQRAAVSWRSRPDGVTSAAPVPVAATADQARLAAAVESEEDAWFFQGLANQGLSLHASQRSAVLHGEGPLLCLAGAGSGKTSVLTARAAYLLTVRGAAPEALWLVTFTNKAAAEMRSRLARLPGVNSAMARGVQARTFHSFALALLQAYAPPFTLLAEERARHGFMRRVLRELSLHDTLQAETVLAALSALKARCQSPMDWRPDGNAERDMQRAMKRFEDQKRERGLKDFDDLLVDLVHLLDSDEALVAKLRRRFRYVMVDEFQDTTPVQIQLLRHVTDGHRNLAVFGDDDQTIYTFNGACHLYMTEFRTTYPDAVQVTLDMNFRSNPAIVGLGNAVIEHNKERLAKTMQGVADLPLGRAGNHVDNYSPPLRANSISMPRYLRPVDGEEEAQLLAEHIQQLVSSGKLRYADIAILYRTGHTSRALVEHLTMNGIPFQQLGAEPLFYEHALVKPLLDHLRLALKPRDFDALGSAVACLYVPKDSGLTYVQQADKGHAKKYPLVHLATCPGIAEFQQAAVKPRIRYIKKLANLKPQMAIRDMRREFYDKYTTAMAGEKATAYQETIAETLEELESSAQRFDTVEAYLKHIEDLRERYAAAAALKPAKAHKRAAQAPTAALAGKQSTDEHDTLTLMTIHRAKGLEFPCVFLIGITEELLPHRISLRDKPPAEKEQFSSMQTNTVGSIDSTSRTRDGKAVNPVHLDSTIHSITSTSSSALDVKQTLLEEERRLLYVGITRARQELFISSPVIVHGKKQGVSRFLIDAWRGPTPNSPALPAK